MNVAFILLILLFAFDKFVLAPQREAELVESATQAGIELAESRVSAIPNESVAVLPFVGSYPNINVWIDRIAATDGWKHPYDLMPRAYPG